MGRGIGAYRISLTVIMYMVDASLLKKQVKRLATRAGESSEKREYSLETQI